MHRTPGQTFSILMKTAHKQSFRQALTLGLQLVCNDRAYIFLAVALPELSAEGQKFGSASALKDEEATHHTKFGLHA